MRPVPEPPGTGQESVWDYPRPPRLEPSSRSIEVRLGGEVVARTTVSWRVLETSHPPTFYLPREAFVAGSLLATSGNTWCEFKGTASYFDLVAGEVIAASAAWTYPSPTRGFEPIAGAVAVMAAATDGCFVDGERVTPQPGGFYGGWVTQDVVGPFKGAPGTWGW